MCQWIIYTVYAYVKILLSLYVFKKAAIVCLHLKTELSLQIFISFFLLHSEIVFGNEIKRKTQNILNRNTQILIVHST